MNCPKCGRIMNDQSCEMCGFNIKLDNFHCLGKTSESIIKPIRKYISDIDNKMQVDVKVQSENENYRRLETGSESKRKTKRKTEEEGKGNTEETLKREAGNKAVRKPANKANEINTKPSSSIQDIIGEAKDVFGSMFALALIEVLLSLMSGGAFGVVLIVSLFKGENLIGTGAQVILKILQVILILCGMFFIPIFIRCIFERKGSTFKECFEELISLYIPIARIGFVIGLIIGLILIISGSIN
ncbi:MAG: hypothetical protein J5824_01665 [Lachnospiraceae bacterium]|nr:hypothetical protein [Lachnospiraceae bacterium]